MGLWACDHMDACLLTGQHLTNDTTEGLARPDSLDHDELVSHFVDIWPGTKG